MGDIVYATFGRIPEDGGKSRIRRRREALRLAISAKAILAQIDDLTMDHADPGHVPVFLPPTLYEKAQAEGYDMVWFVKQKPIPIA